MVACCPHGVNRIAVGPYPRLEIFLDEPDRMPVADARNILPTIERSFLQSQEVCSFLDRQQRHSTISSVVRFGVRWTLRTSPPLKRSRVQSIGWIKRSPRNTSTWTFSGSIPSL